MNDLFAHREPISADEWRQQVAKDLKGADYTEKLVHQVQGVDIHPLYTAEDVPAFDADAQAEFMADLDPEFAEAIKDSGAQHVTWSMVEECQMEAGGDLASSVMAMRNRGITDARICVASESEWDAVFDAIRKLSTPANFYFDATGPLHDDTVSHWRERIGYLGERDRLVQSVEFDPISYWERAGYPADTSLHYNRLAEAFFRISGHLQDCRVLKVDVSDLAESGADVVAQLAACLHRTATYFEALEDRNVPLHELMHLITFRFGVDTQYFFEIAKLRAFKVLWQNLVRVYVPESDFIPNPYIHAVISKRSFTVADKHTNMLRSTTAAMSALLGGADALSVVPFDTEDPNDPQALRLAANLQHILRHESYMDRYRDAAQGSYYIEHLTHTIGERAWQLFISTHNK